MLASVLTPISWKRRLNLERGSAVTLANFDGVVVDVTVVARNIKRDQTMPGNSEAIRNSGSFVLFSERCLDPQPLPTADHWRQNKQAFMSSASCSKRAR